VSHGHFTVDGRKVNIPSYQVKPGQVIAVRQKSRSSVLFSKLTGEDAPFVTVPEWLQLERDELKGTVLRMPERADVDFPVEEHLIVELYSR
jgi:small subunit ribosomal protein S4